MRSILIFVRCLSGDLCLLGLCLLLLLLRLLLACSPSALLCLLASILLLLLLLLCKLLFLLWSQPLSHPGSRKLDPVHNEPGLEEDVHRGVDIALDLSLAILTLENAVYGILSLH